MPQRNSKIRNQFENLLLGKEISKCAQGFGHKIYGNATKTFEPHPPSRLGRHIQGGYQAYLMAKTLRAVLDGLGILAVYVCHSKIGVRDLPFSTEMYPNRDESIAYIASSPSTQPSLSPYWNRKALHKNLNISMRRCKREKKYQMESINRAFYL